MADQSPPSIQDSAIYALVCVGLMILGFGIAAFSTVFVFTKGTGLTPFISLAVPAVFLIHAFFDKFPRTRDWNALKVFTVGAYALCIAPVIILYMLKLILSLFGY